MSNYSDLLKGPKWQKKRLDILSLKGFKCELCGDYENQIQVHHRFYLKGRKPWEYDNDVFQVLCERCHEKEHKKSQQIVEVIPEKYCELIEHVESLSEITGDTVQSIITVIERCMINADYLFIDHLAEVCNSLFFEVVSKLVSDKIDDYYNIVELHLENERLKSQLNIKK